MAGKSPLGACVLIHMQAARTRVAASVHRMTTRAGRDPVLRGVPMAVALPDLPRLREAVRGLVAQAPRPPVTWLFVDRHGRVAAVPPPAREGEAAEPPAVTDQSSTRSGTRP
jgi:hypothetical protein